MSAQILDGRTISRNMTREVTAEVEAFRQTHDYPPAIGVVQVGDDPASAWYVGQIQKSFERVGMGFSLHTLPDDAAPDDLAGMLRGLNADPHTHGIIVQMPLPEGIPPSLVTDVLDPRKDVDGIHPLNAGRLMQASGDYFVPATPAGGMQLLHRYGLPLAGRRAVVVGRSNVVGRPMALLMLHAHATVTVCHSRTRDLAAVTREAEILAVAIGRPAFITADMIRPGAVVLDFGVNVVDDELVGDVDTEAAMEVAGAITPVPGGTGPMTNVMLIKNTLAAAQRQAS
jgi:methylenetetrahydrofolate dehydrogenase (NADP+)/methenyltetrahydrofolate cyclohydrolase